MRSQWFWNIAAQDLMALTPSKRSPGALSGASMAQLIVLTVLCMAALAGAWGLSPAEVEAVAVLSALH